MDVLCAFDAEGFPYCTEFYIKFNSPLVDEAVLSTLGAHDDAGVSSMVFPDASDSEIVDAARKVHAMEHPIHRNDHVQITCNGMICKNVAAFVGPEHILHFYDSTDGSYAKTPSSNVLKNFNITMGKNIVSCIHMNSCFTKEFNIWRYDKNDRLVIMDIDGTITKSDVTGYIQTVYMGLFSYVHEGIVPFLNALNDVHGFHMLYLTARPLAHQRETKQLLEGVKSRGGQGLPDGPLLPNKDRLMAALYREMISKTTMQLKTTILNAVSRVFGRAGCPRRTPFALGIGNKEADALAYNLAGLNAESILLINKASRIEVWKYQQLARLGGGGGGSNTDSVSSGGSGGGSAVSRWRPFSSVKTPQSSGEGDGSRTAGAGGASVKESAEESAQLRSRSEDFASLQRAPPRLLLGAVAGTGTVAAGIAAGISEGIARGEFTDSSSEGSASPMTPTGKSGTSPRQGTSPRSAHIKSGSGVNVNSGRGIVRAFSHGAAASNVEAGGKGGVGGGVKIGICSPSDDMAELGINDRAASSSNSNSQYSFHTYADPRLLQYVHSLAQL